DAKPFSYVLGFYYANVRAHGFYNNIEDVDTPTRVVTGLTSAQRYQATNPALVDPNFNGLVNWEYATREQNLKDEEYAFFGELNYFVTDTLKLTAGVRRADTSFSYRQVFFGAINNSYNPLIIPGAVTNDTIKETPVSPKFGIQWQFTPQDQVYVTAAK